jgi:hypothetical protein
VSQTHKDIALALGEGGEMVAHRADCPVVRALADRGVPVMTMFGLSRPLTRDMVDWHSCLETEPVS